MASDKVTVRKQDGSGAGYVFTRKMANEFLKNNPGYAEEGADETAANQARADAEAKAAEQGEDKAVKTAENKAR